MEFTSKHIGFSTTFQNYCEMVDKGEIKLEYNFEKVSRTWDAQTKSNYIESLILNFPIHEVIILEKAGKLQIVDGLEKLKAIIEFRDLGFKLENLSILNQFNGLQFNELPLPTRRSLMIASVKTHIFEYNNKNVSNESILQLLAKIEMTKF